MIDEMEKRDFEALLIVLKAMRDPEWANWNEPLVRIANACIARRAEDAIERFVKEAKK